MIKSYRIQNFKGLTDVYIEFGWMNVLIGPNMAGKTTILESIDFLRAFLEPSVELYIKQQDLDINDIRNKYSKKKIISYEVKFALPPSGEGRYNGEYMYIVEYNTETNRINKEQLLYRVAEEDTPTVLLRRDMKSFEFTGLNGEKYKGEHIIPSAGTLAFMTEDFANRFPEIVYFKQHFSSVYSFFVWDPKLLRKVSRDEGGLGRYGERLASTLYNIKRRGEETYAKIIRTVRRSLPFVHDIEIKTNRFGWKEIILIEKYSDGSLQKFSSSQLSDGTLRILALAVIRHTYAGGIVTLEEPENGIHPKLVRNMVQLLKELTMLKQKTQVIFTTHSPYVLDEFYDDAFSAVLIVEKGNGTVGTVVRRLGSDPQDINKKRIADLLFNQSLGELWYSGQLEGRD